MSDLEHKNILEQPCEQTALRMLEKIFEKDEASNGEFGLTDKPLSNSKDSNSDKQKSETSNNKIAQKPSSSTITPKAQTADLLDSPIVLMVSGGSDSTALCLIAKAFSKANLIDKKRVCVLHVDHALRGQSSDNDAVFVESLASQCGFSFKKFQIDIASRLDEFDGNMENTARIMRYEIANNLLDEMCDSLALSKNDSFALSKNEGMIWVAHTQDDRVETFFMRAIVGTGPGGLASIRSKNGRIFRPLLNLSREELRAYIETCVKTGTFDPVVLSDASVAPSEGARCGYWREDATNYDSRGFRAFVRNELVPVAKKRNPSLGYTLTRTMDAIASEDDAVQSYIDLVIKEALVSCEQSEETGILTYGSFGEIVLDISKISEIKTPFRRRVIYTICKNVLPVSDRIEQKHIDCIDASLAQNVPSFALDISKNARVEIRGGLLSVKRNKELKQSELARALEKGVELEMPGTNEIVPGVCINIEEFEFPADTTKDRRLDYIKKNSDDTCAFFNLRLVQKTCDENKPLLATNRRVGDKVSPLGMGGSHKLLSDVLIDLKIDEALRDELIILRVTDSIIWVPGALTDEAFKYDSDDSRALKITIVKN